MRFRSRVGAPVVLPALFSVAVPVLAVSVAHADAPPARGHRVRLTVRPRGKIETVPLDRVPALRHGDVLRVRLDTNEDLIETDGLYIARVRLSTDRDSDGTMVAVAFLSPQTGPATLTDRDFPKPNLAKDKRTLEFVVPDGVDDVVPFLFFVPTNRNKKDAEEDWKTLLSQLRRPDGAGGLVARLWQKQGGEMSGGGQSLGAVSQQTQWALKLLADVQNDRKTEALKGVNREELTRRMAEKLGVPVPTDPDAFNWTTAALETFQQSATLPPPEKLSALQQIARLGGSALPAWFNPWIGGVQAVGALTSLIESTHRSRDGRLFEYVYALSKPAPPVSNYGPPAPGDTQQADVQLLPQNVATQHKHILFYPLARSERKPFAIETGLDNTVFLAENKPRAFRIVTSDQTPAPDQIARFATDFRLRPADPNQTGGLPPEGLPLRFEAGSGMFALPNDANLPAAPVPVSVWGTWGPWADAPVALSSPFRLRRVGPASSWRVVNADNLSAGGRSVVTLQSPDAAPLSNPLTDIVWAYKNPQLGTVSPTAAERLPSGDGYRVTFDFGGKPAGPGRLTVTQTGASAPDTVSEGRDMAGKPVEVRVYDRAPLVRPADLSVYAYDNTATIAPGPFTRLAAPVELTVGGVTFRRDAALDDMTEPDGSPYVLRADKPAFANPEADGQTLPVSIRLRDSRTVTLNPDGEPLVARVLPRRPSAQTVRAEILAPRTPLLTLPADVLDLGSAIEITLDAPPGYQFGPSARVRVLKPGADPLAPDAPSVLLSPSPAVTGDGAERVRVRVGRDAEIAGPLVLRLEDVVRLSANAQPRPVRGEYQTIPVFVVRLPAMEDTKLSYRDGRYRLEAPTLDAFDRVSVGGGDETPIASAPVPGQPANAPRQFIEWAARPGLPITFTLRDAPNRRLPWVGPIAPGAVGNLRAEVIPGTPAPTAPQPAPVAPAQAPAETSAPASAAPAQPATPPTVRLEWEPAPGATGYRVYRAATDAELANSSLAPVATLTGNDVRLWLDKTVESGKTYVYRVVAFSPVADAVPVTTGPVAVM